MVEISMENIFRIKGPKYFSFPDEYELVLPAVGSRVIDCPLGRVAIYAHMLDFGLRLPLHPFILKIFQAWNICLSQLTPLGWRNLVAYVWMVRILRGSPKLLIYSASFIGLKKTVLRKVREVGRRRVVKRMRIRGEWMSLYTKSDKLTVYLKLTSLKNWRPMFF